MTGALILKVTADDIAKAFADLVAEIGTERIRDDQFFEDWLCSNASRELLDQDPILASRYLCLLGIVLIRMLDITEIARRCSITPPSPLSPLENAEPAGRA